MPPPSGLRGQGESVLGGSLSSLLANTRLVVVRTDPSTPRERPMPHPMCGVEGAISASIGRGGSEIPPYALLSPGLPQGLFEVLRPRTSNQPVSEKESLRVTERADQGAGTPTPAR